MTVPNELSVIDGAQELHDWFGRWPTFHDAEIISLHLNRTGSSSLTVHTWQMTNDLDEKGFYVLTKHVLVEFILEGIVGLDLKGFNHQNVVYGLAIEKTGEGFQIALEPCYGLAGRIEADKLAIRLTPGKWPD